MNKFFYSMKFVFLSFFIVSLLFSCNSNVHVEEEEKSIWEEREYSLEELIMLFQDWVPENRLEKQVVWLNNTYWEDFKLNKPEEIQKGMRYLPWEGDSAYQTPASYMFFMIGTINKSEGGETFFNPAWNEFEVITGTSGDTFELYNSGSWLEGMAVNYTEEKCSRMMLTFVNEYLNDDAMNPNWKQEKDRWIQEMEKINQRNL